MLMVGTLARQLLRDYKPAKAKYAEYLEHEVGNL